MPELELGALVALLVALWGRIQTVWSWLAGWIVVSQQTTTVAAPFIVAYLRDVGRWRPRNDGFYGTERSWVRPMGGRYRIFLQFLSLSAQRFWTGRSGGRGWRPIWHSPVRGNKGDFELARFFYFRGTIDWEELARS